MCTWIGAQAMIDTEKTGGRNPLVDMAQELDILGTRSDAAEEELDRMRGPRVADRIEDDPRLQLKPVAADPGKGVEAANPDGSFEAFIAMMGGGMGPPAMPGIEQAGDGAQ